MQSLYSFRKPDSNKTLGIEWEMFINREKLARIDGYSGFFYIARDGSIEGCYTPGYLGREIVSQPLPAAWLVSELARWVKKNNLSSSDITPNDSCGIHIHVSRKWLTIPNAEKIHNFISTMARDDLKMLFGRHPNYYCRVGGRIGDSRYLAVNTQPTKTIEIRSFASGDLKWAQWCVLFAEYLVVNAKHLNAEACRAFYDLYWKV